MNMLAKAIAQLRGESPVPAAPVKPALRPARWSAVASHSQDIGTDMLVEYDNGTWAMVYIQPDQRPFVVESSKLSYQP
jgi:hypothetical protein